MTVQLTQLQAQDVTETLGKQFDLMVDLALAEVERGHNECARFWTAKAHELVNATGLMRGKMNETLAAMVGSLHGED